MVRFTSNREDTLLISEIVKRAKLVLFSPNFDALSLHMDLSAAHASCPLKLKELLQAEEFDFAHDICGIQRHINRQTGELEDFFLPRYAQPEPEALLSNSDADYRDRD